MTHYNPIGKTSGACVCEGGGWMKEKLILPPNACFMTKFMVMAFYLPAFFIRAMLHSLVGEE